MTFFWTWPADATIFSASTCRITLWWELPGAAKSRLSKLLLYFFSLFTYQYFLFYKLFGRLLYSWWWYTFHDLECSSSCFICKSWLNSLINQTSGSAPLKVGVPVCGRPWRTVLVGGGYLGDSFTTAVFNGNRVPLTSVEKSQFKKVLAFHLELFVWRESNLAKSTSLRTPHQHLFSFNSPWGFVIRQWIESAGIWDVEIMTRRKGHAAAMDCWPCRPSVLGAGILPRTVQR